MQFEWNDMFKTGIPIIDEQHKELFRIGARVNELWLSYDVESHHDEILKEVSSLEKYAHYHFQTEEALLDKYLYEEAEAHKTIHRDFLKFIDEIKLNEDHKSDKELLSELIRFIMKWIFKHVSSEDQKYKEHIRAQLK